MPELPALRVCPGQKPIYYPAIWYKIAEIDPREFTVCSKCHTDYILSSPFVADFSTVSLDWTLPTTCDFNTPRMHMLWAEAIEFNHLSNLRQYINRRAEVPPCVREVGVQGPSTTTLWYSLKPSPTGTIDGFVVCEACYQDDILAALPFFSGEFVVHPQMHDTENLWTCDIGTKPFIREIIAEIGHSDPVDLDRFVQLAKTRMSAPHCAGMAGTKLSGTRWFKPSSPKIPRMVACESCYYDFFLAHPSRRADFDPNPIIKADDNDDIWICDLAVPAIRFPATQKLNIVPMDGFHWRNTATLLSNSPCHQDGILSDEWYTLNPPVKDVDICAGCLSGFIRPLNLDSHFTRQTVTEKVHKICDLQRQSTRFPTYIDKLEEAYATQNFTIFAQYCQERSKFPPCPGSLATTGRYWYGTEYFFACQECYHDIIE